MSTLAIDKEQEKTIFPATATAKDPLNSSQNSQQEGGKPVKIHSKKLANRLFNIANYLGLGWAANSTLSLFITYNALPTDPAQHLIKVAEHNVGEPLVKTWNRLKGLVGLGKSFEALGPVKQKLHIAESARSAAEILCMCIAGCIVLIPMKLMEDHKPYWVDKIDSWIHGKKSQANASGEIVKEVHEKSERQTWGKLLVARVLGMGAVLGIDGQMQKFNNKRFDKGAANFDSVEWKAGSWLYDNMHTKTRDGLIKFFTRKKADIEGIQPAVRDHLLKTIEAPDEFKKIVDELGALKKQVNEHPSLEGLGWADRIKRIGKLEETIEPQRNSLTAMIDKNPEFRAMRDRAIMAEQTRLFSKEISLTLVMAGLIYGLSKTGILSSVKKGVKSFFIGKEKEEDKKDRDILMEDSPLMPVVHIDTNGYNHEEPQKKFSETVKPKTKPINSPESGFARKLSLESAEASQPQVGA